LVHEAYLRLIDQSKISFQDRTHFFALASQTMRRILVEHARSKGRQKRGGDRQRVSLEGLAARTDGRAAPLEDLADALEALAAQDERAAKVMEMFHLGGMKQREIAEVLGVSDRTVRDELSFARVWLFRRLGGGPDAKK
jgi:RNA polymerase sigma factor (TIGR02999 family)